MKHQHNTITTTPIIYLGLFLLIGIISNVAFAQTTSAPSTPKISLAKVTDSGTSPKTAVCLIVQPAQGGEKFFCVYDNKYRDNANDSTKIFDSITNKLINEKISDKIIQPWLKKANSNQGVPKAQDISRGFAEFAKDSQSITDKTLFGEVKTLTLIEQPCQANYNTFAPLITPEVFALFVHDFIHHHLQKSEDKALIKSFCSNTATALVLLDEAIQPLLQNPDVVKLLNYAKARSFLESVKGKENLLALLTPDKKDTKNFAKLLEILGNKKVTELLTKDEVVKLLRDSEVVKALSDKEFDKRIGEAINKYSEINTRLSDTQKVLDETKKLLEEAKTKLSPGPLKDSIVAGFSNTLAEKLAPLEKKLDKPNTGSGPGTLPESQTVPVIVVCFLIVAILLVFFWLYEREQWKDVLVDNESIIRKEFSNLDNTPQIQTMLNRLATTIEKKISAIPQTGASVGDDSGTSKAISEIQTAVRDAVAYAFTDYQNQQPRPPVVAESASLQQVSERVEVINTTLTNYPTGQQLITSLEDLYRQGQQISNRLPLEPSFWTQLKGVVEQSIPQMSKQVSDINTALTGKPPVTLTDLTQSLSSTKEELKAALADSQKQQHSQMAQSLESLDGKVADIDKLLKSKKLWEEAVLNPVKGVIDTTLDFHKRLEAEKSRREALEKDRDTLLTVFEKRFGYIPPDRANLSPWITTLIEQPGTWRWSQSPLWQQLVICQGLLQQLQQREIAKDIQEILTLLFDKDQRFFTGWETLTAQFFKSDLEMWNYLRTLDGGRWLNSLFRANDLLHSYFADKPQFGELSKHLATTAGLLKIALAGVGIGFLEPPKLLENVPTNIPEKFKDYTPSPLLKRLVKSKVVEKSKTAPHLVVDIEAYGFATPDNPQPEIRVIVFSPAEWQ